MLIACFNTKMYVFRNVQNLFKRNYAFVECVGVHIGANGLTVDITQGVLETFVDAATCARIFYRINYQMYGLLSRNSPISRVLKWPWCVHI